MSTTQNPYGFSHIARIGGKPRAQTLRFNLAAAYNQSIAAGDPVSFTNGNTLVTIPTIPGDATTQATLGVFNSVEYIDVLGNKQMTTLWVANTPVAAGTLPVIIVDVDYNSIYQVQCNGVIAGASATVPGTGRNYNYVLGAPNAVTKTSTAALNTTGGGGPEVWRNCTIVGLAGITNNSWADAFPDVLVVFNNHKFKQGTLGSN